MNQGERADFKKAEQLGYNVSLAATPKASPESAPTPTPNPIATPTATIKTTPLRSGVLQ
jgi:hypothetical protein